MITLRSLAGLLSLTACLGVPTGTDPSLNLGPGKRLLFIGNSLTYVNDLPGVVSALARLAGDTIEVRTVAYPNFALEDHWNDGTAVQALRATRWDVVIMQQGPSSLPENQQFLLTWTQVFAPVIRESGAVPALYMVWPASSRPGDFVGVKAAYKNAARAVGGMFMPAGEAWRVALVRDPTVPVYGSDGFHPSITGTVLAALVIYERVSGRNMAALTIPTGFAGLSATMLRFLQDVAHETVLAEGG